MPKPLDELTNEEMIAAIEENLSKGAYQRANTDQPFNTRTKSELTKFVQERVLEEEVKGTWSLTDSLFKADQIRADAAKIILKPA